MLFQILLIDEIRNVFYYLQAAGVLEILIPFVLIFTVLFAVLKQVEIFKQEKEKIVVALAITLLVIVPHITGAVPPEYDVVQIINNSLPSIVLIIFIVLMAIILLGFVTGKPVKLKGLATGICAIASLILVAVIFMRSAGYLQGGLPSWLYWLDDPHLGALIVVIAMFALITWFITYQSDTANPLTERIKGYIEKFGEELFGGGGVGGR